jgi:hypothetical protein
MPRPADGPAAQRAVRRKSARESPAVAPVPDLPPFDLSGLLDRLARHETDLAAMRRRLRNGFAAGKP